MKLLNYITDYRLNQLINDKPIKALEPLQKIMNKHRKIYKQRTEKLKTYINDNELLVRSIIYLHTQNIITLNAKQLKRVIELKNKEVNL